MRWNKGGRRWTLYRKQLAAQKAAADTGLFDLVIVGAGPAGISASLGAVEKGLRYCTIEQDTMGGTVAHYPRGKLVMTAPAISAPNRQNQIR